MGRVQLIPGSAAIWGRACWRERITARWVALAVLLVPLFVLVWLVMPLLQLLAWLVKRRGLR